MNSKLSKEEKNILFFGKYKIIKLIGHGSFGNVHEGINIKDNKKVAIKVEKKECGYDLLKMESYYLFNLRGIGVPELITYGYSGKYNVLVQSLLGESLGKIFFENNNYFSLKDICMFTIQILHRIEFVHSKNLIHRDIKPENFLIGDPDKYMIYIIDFGLSKKYRSSRTNKHIQFKCTKKFTGTARYASINAIRGIEQSRRDDLEAIGYMLMYFFNGGKLPWKGISCKEKQHKYAKIYKMKKDLDYKEFCKNMPKQIIEYMNYCKNLPFEKDPDYEYLRNLFELALKNNGLEYDLKFSWIKDYSILNNIEEIKNKIIPKNAIKRKQSPRIRIIKKLENAKETSREKENSNTNRNLLTDNVSQKILKNTILKAKTFNLQSNIEHKRFNSSCDAKGLIGKDSEMFKSSIAKYNSIIDDEEFFNNISNNNCNISNNNISIKNILEKNNYNITNNRMEIPKNNNKNNLYYFSNFPELSKSFNNNNNNISNSNIKPNEESIKKTGVNLKKNFINNINKNLNCSNVCNNNKNENNSPNIIKSLC